MKRFSVWAVVCVSLQAAFGNPLHGNAGRIIGGIPAPEGRYPFIASLRAKNEHFCGAAILNANWVVTAAHCLVRAPSPITVVVGTNWLNQGGDSYQALEEISHEDYHVLHLQNDIALIRVPTIAFNERVQPVPIYGSYLPGDAPAIIAGWGSARLGGDPVNELQYLSVKTVTVDQCQEKHREDEIVASQVCTLSKRGEGACHGDSGGPVITTNPQLGHEDVLIGLVSWGRPCARGVPDVQTRVYSFIGWINEKCGNCAVVV